MSSVKEEIYRPVSSAACSVSDKVFTLTSRNSRGTASLASHIATYPSIFLTKKDEGDAAAGIYVSLALLFAEIAVSIHKRLNAQTANKEKKKVFRETYLYISLLFSLKLFIICVPFGNFGAKYGSI